MGTEPSDELEVEEQGATVDRIRKVLADGFSFVRSREVSLSVSTITFEESVSRAIADINDDETNNRIGKLSTVNNLKEELVKVVEEARSLPPAVFFSTRSTPMNTNEDGSGPGENNA